MGRWLRPLLALFCCGFVVVHPAVAGGREVWVLLPQPKFLAHPVTVPIAGAKETVLAAAHWTDIGPDFATSAEWSEGGMDAKKITLATRENARVWLKEVKPEYVRDSRRVVEYARIKSDKVPVAALVLTPEFVKEFEGAFGPKMIVVMPNLYTVFVFPSIAGRHEAYSAVVLGEWHSRAPKVSREVFELTADGLRAVGIFEE